jgi:hypothetical protein
MAVGVQGGASPVSPALEHQAPVDFLVDCSRSQVLGGLDGRRQASDTEDATAFRIGIRDRF